MIRYHLDKSQEKKCVTLYFLRDELLYDIRQNAYNESTLLADDQYNVKRVLADIAEEDNIDRVHRLLSRDVELVKAHLFPYVVDEELYDEVYNRVEEPYYYPIEMALPKNYSDNGVRLLSKLVHEYLVDRVLYDWTLTAYPEAAKKWYERSEETLQEINSAKNLQRGGAFTRRMSVF